MKMVVHDLTSAHFKAVFPNTDHEVHVISDKGKIKHCIGCFGCWIKTPGKCVLKDGYENMGVLLAKADEIIIISRCQYGAYSPFVKTVIERWLAYLLPFFTLVKNVTHHKPRYQNRLKLSVYFYGDNLSEEEKRVAKALVEANSVNFCAENFMVHFFQSSTELEGVSLS